MDIGIMGEQGLPKQNKKSKKVTGILLGVGFAALAAGFVINHLPAKEEVTYKESTVAKGILESGVTVRGSVDIGTIEQAFELDMSALQRVSKSGSGSSSSSKSQSGSGAAGGFGSMGGMSGQMTGGFDFSQTMNLAGSSTFVKSGDSSSLTVEEVCVSVGQEISKGDTLYLLEADSVDKLKTTLESDVDKAKADLDMMYADQKVSKQSAQSTYDKSIAYGDYMQTEYNETIAELQDAVQEATDTLNEAKETLAEYKSMYAEAQTAYEKAAQVAANCEWSRDHADKSESVYNYVYFFEQAQQAESTAQQLEQKMEQLESRIESAEKTVTQAQKSLNQAKRSLEQGKLEAEETLQLRTLAYETAQETYDITMAYLETDVKEQEETYAQAKEKWESFSSYIDGNAICSLYDGTITSVELKAGDSVTTNTLLVTVNSRSDMTMTVSVDEDDMEGIALGTKAKVVLTAFPEEAFEASVTEISEASSDRSGNVTYEVTATLQGELTKLYQGMTGEITFITGETEEEVLYVSRRAVTTNGDTSTVKVRAKDGSITERAVVTGFTDGVYIEIREGLSEGDTVLTESKVIAK